MSAKRKIDVEESKRLGRIVTKEVDENDPDYKKYLTDEEYVDDFYIKDSWLDEASSNRVERDTGIEHFYFFLFLLFFLIPGTFIVLKIYIQSKENSVLFVLLDVIPLMLYPIFILRRKDLSLYHKRILKIIMGNSIVVLMWLGAFIIAPIIMNIDIPLNKAKIALLLYMLLFIFDLTTQIVISNKKEKYKDKSELFDRLSLLWSIAAIWGYGAIICPLIFSKTIQRIIFDIVLLVLVIVLSIVNMIVYKSRKNVVQEDYKYTGLDFHKGSRMLLMVFFQGILVAIMCIALICIDFL